MAKKRRVARQKFMDRLREIDQERRSQIAARQEYGKLKQKRGSTTAKRDRAEATTEDDDTAPPRLEVATRGGDGQQQTHQQPQSTAAPSAAALERNRVKSRFESAAAKPTTAGDTAQGGHARGGAEPGKIRRVEQD